MANLILNSIYLTGLLMGLFLMWKIPAFKAHKKQYPRYEHVSILIPARNEEKRIEPLLQSIKANDFLGELIVIDDESTDQTAHLAKHYGAQVIHSKPLPKGWRGKSWALYQGKEAAKYDTLMLLDADTAFEKDGLAKILDTYYLDETPLSIQPYHAMQAAYEQLSIVFNVIILMASNLYTPFQRKFKPRVFYGPVQIMSKHDYTRVEHNQAVNKSVLDDIEMGRVLLQEGRPIRAVVGTGAIRFRMYPGGFKESVFGWSKSFATGAILIGALNMMMISIWLTSLYGAFLRPLWMEHVTWVQWAIYFAAGLELYWMGRRVGNFSLFTLVLFPLQALYFFAVFIISLNQTLFKKRVNWRGRNIDLGDE